MGKAIRNFKDALSGVEEAKFRRLNEEKAEDKTPKTQTAQTVDATPSDKKPS